MMNQPPDKSLAGARYRGLLIIWGAQISLLVVPFVLTLTLTINPTTDAESTQLLLLALGATALTAFVLSFVVKTRLLARAARERRPDLVTTGYIIAFALCESCAFFGLVAHFTTGAGAALYFFVPAVFGFLFHFPRRRHLEEVDGGAGPGFKSTF